MPGAFCPEDPLPADERAYGLDLSCGRGMSELSFDLLLLRVWMMP